MSNKSVEELERARSCLRRSNKFVAKCCVTAVLVKLFAQCSGVNPCMMMHGCTVDLSTCTRWSVVYTG